MKYLSVLLIAVMATLPSAFAAPIYIDHAGQNYWTNVDMGLDFLDLTETENMGRAAVDLAIQSGGSLEGWRFATTVESTALYNSFAVSLTGWTTVNHQNAELWFHLFGIPQAWQGAWNNGEATSYSNWQRVYDEVNHTAHIAVDATRGWFHSSWNFTSDRNNTPTPNAALLVRTTAPVPEPSTYALMLLGLIGLGVYKRKSKKA